MENAGIETVKLLDFESIYFWNDNICQKYKIPSVIG